MIRIFIILITSLFFFNLQAQDHDAVVVNQMTKINVRNNRLYKYESYEIRINNRAGDKYSEIVIPYSGKNKLSNINAIIKDRYGNIVKKLKKSDIKERNAFSNSFYEDEFVKEFTIRHNTYPYTIKYSFETVLIEYMFLEYWQPIYKYIPTLKAKLFVELPNNYNIFYDENLLDEAHITSNGLTKKYIWELSYTDPVEYEIYSPPITNYLPKVVIVPENFRYSIKGSFKDWDSFGTWQSGLNKNLSDLSEIDSLIILSTVKGISTEKEKIKKLYHYLQDNTRYINISIETGGLKPYPASYVAKNKYGDCKALSNYFKSILGVIGIEANYTKVYAGNKIREINKSFPSQQFNHIILNIPLSNDTIWLDCTSKGPFNYLGTFTQNRETFVVKEDTSYFQKTPALSLSEVLEKREIKISADEYLNAKASFKCVYKGENYETLNNLSKFYNESEKQQVLRKYYIESGFDLNNYKLTESDRDSAKIYFQYNAEAENLYRKYGNEIIIEILPIHISKFEKPIDRKLPVQLNYPINKIDTLEYEIVDGFQISNLPKNKKIESKFGRYNIECQQKNKSVQIVKSFILKSGHYSIDEYEEFQQFIDQIKETENNNYIVIEKRKEL